MWLNRTTASERRTLLAGFAGYGLDGFDVMIYTFVIPTLLRAWSMSKAEAGSIATGMLVTSALGGWGAGVLADRFGRVRILQLTVLWFAVFTCLSGFTQSFGQLLFTRAMQGFGFGGEWAVGSVLVAETIDARYRGRATGLVQSSWSVGWALAALAFWGVYALAPASLSWRILFWMGILPALLIVYIRRKVQESSVYTASRGSSGGANFLHIFRAPLLRTTVLASLMSTGMLGAYYSVTTWLPTYLATERHLSVTGTTGYLLVVIAGSFAGYLTSASMSDALGRRRCFVLFAVCGILLVLAYTRLPITDGQMLLLGFPLGFVVLGIFAGMGAFLTELYPCAVRGSGQGFSYSMGRAVGGVCPWMIGIWSAHWSLAGSIGITTAAAYALVIAAAWLLPETKGAAV
jgi:MFS family permease